MCCFLGINREEIIVMLHSQHVVSVGQTVVKKCMCIYTQFKDGKQQMI